MENSKVLKTILFLLSIPLLVLGGWRLLMPIEFHAFSGIILGSEVGLLSEARGAGGFIFASGIVIMSGVFSARMRFTSTLLAALLFLSFGFARLLGIAIDGMPGEMLIQGIIGEFVMGSIALVAFLKYRNSNQE